MKKHILSLLTIFFFSISVFAQTTDELYLLGDATDAEWDNTAGLSMMQISDGIFSISANINGTGEWIKFIEVPGQWAPQWGTDEEGTATSGNLVYRETEAEPDLPAIPAPQIAGTYTIVANLNEATYTITTSSSTGLITTDPEIPTDANPVTITFDATQGSGGLSGYTGDVYAHTGVITNLSADGTDWKYVITRWGENTEETLLTRIEDNIYELEITPSIREYYGVPEEETIRQMAFVFRSSEEVDGEWLTGKTEEGGDIFVNVYETGLNLTIHSPESQSIFLVGQDVWAHAMVTPVGTDDVTNFGIYVDNELIDSSDTNEVFTTFQFTSTGNHTITFSADNGTYTDQDSVIVYVLDEQVYEELPEGVIDGINYIDDNTVTLVLHAPYKNYVLLIGDFNNWELTGDYLMKKTPDNERYWITITDLTPGEEYAFQYNVDGEIRIADPYCEKILDPWNDTWIPNSNYPDLKEYPEDLTSEIVGILQTAKTEFVWEIEEFEAPPVEELVIYELHIRDFTEQSSINAVYNKLDYLEELGVNAIELMPINEFEGNDSWGYNPSFYFASDKYYGTEEAYKTFIDECHKRGIAVIIDMVLNHSFGQSPFLRLYMDNWQPTSENPWYNVDCPHEPWCWGADFDHESELVQTFVDRVNSYWLTKYKVDGFRFDFTKGFTNNIGDGWAYDADRIALLKRMADEIWAVNSDAYVILEHLTANNEEEELSDYGMLLWGNMNYSYNEGTMGWNDDGKSDFSWISYQERGWSAPHVIGYMESHDEERLMYKNLMYGNVTGSYDIQNLHTALRRIELAINFFIPIPGPKMIWQFGELGYDYSINTCSDGVTIDEGCRTARKPIRWDYLDFEVRQRPYVIYSSMNKLKQEYDVFNTTDYSLDLAEALKKIQLNDDEMNVTILGNFDVVSGTIVPAFQHTGTWYEYYSGDSVEITDVNATISLEAGEYRFYTDIQLETPEIPENIRTFNSQSSRNIQVYPNPAVKSVTFEIYSKTDEVAEVELINQLGQTINRFEITLSANKKSKKLLQLNKREMQQGIYFYRIIINNESNAGRLIIH